MKTAKQLTRTTFRTSRLLDFASEKELVAQCGHRRADWLLVIAKELIDNALDAAESCGIPPEILVKMGRDFVEVGDNGAGLPDGAIDGILDFTVRTSTKLHYVSPTRGSQGNALKTILFMPFVLRGEERSGHVDIASRGVRHDVTVEVDQVRQEPVIRREDHKARFVKNGTFVRVHLPDSRPPIPAELKRRFLQICEGFAWVNPHLDLRLEWEGDPPRHFRATDPMWTKWLETSPTSAHWYKPADLERLIGAYVKNEQDRPGAGAKTVRAFVSEFDGLSGTAKQKRVLEATGLERTKLADLAADGRFRSDVIGKLLVAMKANSRPVKAKRLGVIGEAHLRRRCEEAGAVMQSFKYRKTTELLDGIPSIAEFAFAWLGEREPQKEKVGCGEKVFYSTVDPRRFIPAVNWSPGILNPFRELGRAGESLDSILERQRAGRGEPVIMVLHLACPRTQYCDRGKSTVVVDGEEG